MINWEDYPDFSREEFDSPDVPGSGDNMQKKFLDQLQLARSMTTLKFNINSGYRTESHNAKVKGKKNSAHLRGYAADIQCRYSRDRFTLINVLIKAGFNRIGIAKSFIHVDNDPSLEPNVYFMY